MRDVVGDWKVIWGFFTCMQFARITKPPHLKATRNLPPPQSKLAG